MILSFINIPRFALGFQYFPVALQKLMNGKSFLIPLLHMANKRLLYKITLFRAAVFGVHFPTDRHLFLILMIHEEISKIIS